jgi:hypothetical protein
MNFGLINEQSTGKRKEYKYNIQYFLVLVVIPTVSGIQYVSEPKH